MAIIKFSCSKYNRELGPGETVKICFGKDLKARRSRGCAEPWMGESLAPCQCLRPFIQVNGKNWRKDEERYGRFRGVPRSAIKEAVLI